MTRPRIGRRRSARPPRRPPAPRAGRPQPVRHVLPLLAVLGLSALVVAGLAIVPARTYLSQRQEMNEAEAQLAQLRTEVAELDARLTHLRTDDAIERIAREHYDLVLPGEESYRILPAAGS